MAVGGWHLGSRFERRLGGPLKAEQVLKGTEPGAAAEDSGHPAAA